ncbi:protease, ATP-dependent zinc-metallo [uncultured delta proteobacterium]|uniref:ATP-dependent zinc metalloprotease FtsH n=1 Tax=uncultured delta proteobacterium TaxID=34034 RepID=A0A212ITQ7_9DELT|nr:protease, ATP-dependent zinc-metallo [uncultured delta proteobacterium]
MNQFTRNLILWGIISLLMVALFNAFSAPPAPQSKMDYSAFLQNVEEGKISEVTLQGKKILGRTMDGVSFQTYAPEDPQLVPNLVAKNVVVKAEPPEEASWLTTLLVSWLPMLIIIGVWVFFMRQMQGGGGKAMSFGRSRARMISQESAKVTFADVAGIDEAKEELTEVVDFLSNPKKFTRLGGRIPKGVLLVGPPGTGKTLLARAVAGEAGVPFFSISGSDFVEMFVGVGASRVRDLFAQGKKNAPCLIFIDEIDAVGRQRGAGLGGGHDEREQTLNQMLVEMDGFEANEGVILIAATNRPDVLDPALLRPGRFDRQVVVPSPDVKGRKQILAVHSRRTPLAPNVDLDVLARGTPGFSGADLENLVNEAALMAARMNKDLVSMAEFEEAKDKLLMGKERRTMVQTEEERKKTAYHEAGHALVSVLLPGTDPVHKVTIVPRGRALGLMMPLPERDRYGMEKSELESRIAIALAGRAAEMIIYNNLTTGASDDINKATQTARAMVCRYGMSDTIGPVAIGEQNQEVFIGREWVSHREHSEETARLVDAEVRRIIESAMNTADTLLRDNIDILHKLAAALLERETLTGADIDKVRKGEELPPLENKAEKDLDFSSEKRPVDPQNIAPETDDDDGDFELSEDDAPEKNQWENGRTPPEDEEK